MPSEKVERHAVTGFGKHLGFYLLLAGLAVSVSAQTYVNRVYDGQGGYSIVIKEISGTESWTEAGSPYIVEADVNFDYCGVNVQAGGSLSIEPGTEIRFMFGRGHASLIVRGTLQAAGTADKPIVFNPARDDYEPEWGGIQLLGGATATLSHVTINCAGHVNSGWQTGFVDAALYIDSCSPVIGNCRIDSSHGDGIRINRAASPSITDCIIDNSVNNALNWMDVANSAPVMSGISGTGNRCQGLAIGYGRMKKNVTLGRCALPYYLTGYDNVLVVDTGATLTIEAGAVLKSNYGRDGGALVVDNGTLNIQGTTDEPVVFTSYLDDSIAGDFTAADTAHPYPGAWSGLRFYNGAKGTVNNVVVKYAGHVTTGWQGWHPGAAIYLQNSSLLFTNMTVEKAEGCGVKFGNSASVFTDCAIRQSGDWAILQDGDTLRNMPVFNATAAVGNAVNGIGIYGICGFDQTFADTAMAYVIRGWLTIPAGKTLTLDPGVAIKSVEWGNSYRSGLFIDGGTLDAEGTSTIPIVFTSAADDAVKGNSDNNDTLQPKPSDWNGVVARNGADVKMM